MAVKKFGRLLAYRDFTHYLGIPIVTPSSRSQLQASFARFEREASDLIPKGSVLNLEHFLFAWGRLRLESKERIDACSRHLHKLDLGKMLRDAAVAAMSGPPIFDEIPYIGDAPALGVATTLDLSPLKVDISGIFSPFDDPSQTRVLRASVIDRTHRMQHFQHILSDSLFKAGFLTNAFFNTIVVVNTAVPTGWGYRGIYDRRTGRWSFPKRPKAPKLDARDLIHDWKDYNWATNIQLEQIGIYPLGSRVKSGADGVRLKQMTEVDSIALPQANDMNNSTELH